MKDVYIRKANSDELEWALLQLQNTQIHSMEYVWIALVGDTPVGCARAEFFRDSTLATIAGVFVEKSCAGHKIGLKLTQEIMQSFSDVSTWFLAGKPWIEKYYAAIGFEKVNEIIPELKRDITGQVFMVFTR